MNAPIELFDGKTLARWRALNWVQSDGPIAVQHGWQVASDVDIDPEDKKKFIIKPGTGVMVNGDDGRTGDLITFHEHGDCELHIEFCIAHESNSGVYFQGQYELQIRDDYDEPDEELAYRSSGGIYGRRDPITNEVSDGGPPLTKATRAPGVWQAFDVIFRAPRFDEAGNKIKNAKFERVVFNGKLVQSEFECTGPTGGALSENEFPYGSLRLQGDHGPVAFRNIRMRGLD